MIFKIKTTEPKRDDIEYKEIEAFEDFELLNNAVYEMAIRTIRVKELFKIYNFCDKFETKLAKRIKLKKIVGKKEQVKDITQQNELTLKSKTPKENFEEELKNFEENYLINKESESYRLLKLDIDTFIKEIDIFPLEDKTDIEISNIFRMLFNLSYDIVQIIQYEYYLDFFECMEKKLEGTEYEESLSQSLYIKRDFKKDYYIETIIDIENNKLTKTMYPLIKRKLFTDHILRFSSNHLIFYKEAIKLLEDFFKMKKMKIKKQKALADAFFCFDYYKYRLEKVNNYNKKAEERNSKNIVLKEANDYIEEIKANTFLLPEQKNKEIKKYEEIIKYETIKKKGLPTLNKKSKYYIFKEKNFLNSGINENTALSYYQWISPYIDNYEYKNIINPN